MKNILPLGILLCGLALLINACETDDIEPTLSVALSTTSINVSEDMGTTSILATLNAISDQTVTVKLAVSGDAVNTIDYTLNALDISIPAGNLSAGIQLSALQDTIEEGNESINISVSSIVGAKPRSPQTVAISLQDDDVAPIILNEILYDPSNSGLDGDANGDGVYSQAEDEFLEFVNISDQSVDLSGYKIFDAENLVTGIPNHLIPANTIIPPRGVLLIFGGGTPTGNFGGAIVQTSTSGDMNLNNQGDVMTLTDSANVEIVSFDINPLLGNPNRSYTRNPDITGAFETHNLNTPLLFSPGTKVDGTSF